MPASPAKVQEIRKQLDTLNELERVRLRYQLYQAFMPVYAAEVLRGPPEYGGRFLLGRHHLEWGRALSAQNRILAIAARDHGKSQFFSLAYPLWMSQVRAPGRWGIVTSATDKQARHLLKKIRQEVEGGGENGLDPNPRLADLLPFRKGTNERNLIFANGSHITANGFGSKVRGGHPWWIVGDDMLNDEHVWSQTVREKAADYFLSAIEPMPVPQGQLIVVGTPFHAEDTYKQLEKSGEYFVLKHPAVDAVTGAALWPERYDEKALARKKRILGSALRWSREYLCQPISDDSSVFPSWLFDQRGIKQPYPLGLPGKHWHQRGFSIYIGVDLAISTSANADYFVAFVLGIGPSGDVWVIDIIRHQGVGYQTQIDTIVSLAKSYDAQFVFVESNQFQRVITDMVIRESTAPIKAFYTTGRGGSKQASTQRRGMAGAYSANKNSLDRGVPGLRMLLENLKLRIPWDPLTQERVQTWINEMTSFSFVQGKLQGVGAHDDTVMAFWMAERAAAMGGGFGVWFGEEVEAATATIDASSPVVGFEPPAAVIKPIVEEEEAEYDWFGLGEEKKRSPMPPGSTSPRFW